jgi:hypothetical protein
MRRMRPSLRADPAFCGPAGGTLRVLRQRARPQAALGPRDSLQGHRLVRHKKSDGSAKTDPGAPKSEAASSDAAASASTTADAKPGAGGDAKPSTTGDAKPASTGESKPAQDGGKKPESP